jgi:hypothetical protein
MRREAARQGTSQEVVADHEDPRREADRLGTAQRRHASAPAFAPVIDRSRVCDMAENRPPSTMQALFANRLIPLKPPNSPTAQIA